jgi:hypothetical protein
VPLKYTPHQQADLACCWAKSEANKLMHASVLIKEQALLCMLRAIMQFRSHLHPNTASPA